MSITSLTFLAFLLITAICYYALPKKWSPYIILLSNVYFYMQFDLRYSLFLGGSIITTFLAGILIEKTQKENIKKLILTIVLALNIGVLFFVKFAPYILRVGTKYLGTPEINLNVLVAVGISFYTLQLCGYCIDIYRKKYSAERNIFKYAAFGSFFPLMLQGPISRYNQLAPTLFAGCNRKEIYENFTAGAQIMLWGFFKKLVIADRAALLVNPVFDNFADYSGVTVIGATLCYTLQIYADFTGCVDICRGAAKIFGIDVMENFRQPYFSTSIQDFWKRWHIALSSWLRDYVYFPLGGNRKGTVRKYINLIIVFFVSGLWHGVGLHFMAWGMLQAVYQISGALLLPIKKKICALAHINRESEAFKWVQRIINLGLINFSWTLFRVAKTDVAFKMTASMFEWSGIRPIFSCIDKQDLAVLAVATLVLVIVEYYREKDISVRAAVSKTVIPVRWAAYLLLFLAVLIFGIYGPGYSAASFIYMNF